MMRTTIILTVLLLGGTLCHAQRDSSLTHDFARLSAKERSRIAAREQEESMSDLEFQVLMENGEKLFQQRDYDAALVEFRAARSRRPYNVHPKVKIQDLEALIKKRDQQAALSSEAPKPPVITQNSEQTPKADILLEPTQAIVVPEQMAQEVAKPIAKSKPSNVPMRAKEPVYPGERIFKEGRAVVVERVIEEEGRIMVYRKVNQPWGEAIFFRDEIAITERVWEETFRDRMEFSDRY